MYNPFSLKRKKILVTGASSGIGKAIAIECSKMGASVILTARNEAKLKMTLSQMLNPSLHRIIACDLSKEEDIYQLIESIDSTLEGVVQCAGFTITKPFIFLKRNDIDEILDVNFMAPVILTQQLIKKKKLQKNSSIVFISSISGVYISSVGGSIYSASKSALDGIMKGMAIELAEKNIRVNSVNPGMIETEIYKEGIITPEQLEIDKKRYPLKRYGKPKEVAYAVIYLLSDASLWVTGSNLKIDGGFT
ncbi:MAG: SDR family oxidoreductase, partial [Odoribacter sp.]|nr:SDR family oxidoreductase [Odoribacter sp.]